MPEEQEVSEEAVAPVEAAQEEVVAEQVESPQQQDVDVDSLPENIKEYIHELREEAKDRRKAHEPYKEAFKDYNDAEKEYLLNMVNTLSTNQPAGATAMKQLAQHLLGENTTPEPEPEVSTSEVEESELIATSEVSDLVQEELRKEKMVQGVHAESRALGFEPNTPECKIMWDLALTPAINGDLVKAAELARAYLGDDAPPNPLAPKEETPSTEFPTSATISGSGAITADLEQREVPSIKSDAMRDKVLARLNSQIGE